MPRDPKGIGWFREKYARLEKAIVNTTKSGAAGTRIVPGSVVYDVAGAIGLELTCAVSAVGTSITFGIETSRDGVTWFKSGATDTIAAAETVRRSHAVAHARYVRIVETVVGTEATFGITVNSIRDRRPGGVNNS